MYITRNVLEEGHIKLFADFLGKKQEIHQGWGIRTKFRICVFRKRYAPRKNTCRKVFLRACFQNKTAGYHRCPILEKKAFEKMKTFFSEKHSIIFSNFSNFENFQNFCKKHITKTESFKKLYHLIRILQQICHL